MNEQCVFDFPRTLQTKVHGGICPTLGRTANVCADVGKFMDRVETSPRFIMGDGAEDAYEHAMDEAYGDDR